jgi:hypothetical protein
MEVFLTPEQAYPLYRAVGEVDAFHGAPRRRIRGILCLVPDIIIIDKKYVK